MRTIRNMGLAAAALAMAGCGGGGASGGIDRLGISSGPINGFASVIVDGVRYRTDAATVFIVDDASGTQADLRVGQVVTIHWRSRDGGETFVAESVLYDDAVEGPVSLVDVEDSRLVVLGQTVLVDADTSFDGSIVPGDITGITVGDGLVISGLADADGAIRATRITREETLAELEVRGIVGSVAGNTFTINDLTVNASGVAMGAQDCPDGQINVGDYVEARGPALNGQGQLVATVVECEDGEIPAGTTGEFGNVVGYVADFADLGSFRVAGVPVDAAGAVFLGGTADELADNVRVKVRGEFDGNGVLVADTVEYKSTGPASTNAGALGQGGNGNQGGNGSDGSSGNGNGNGGGSSAGNGNTNVVLVAAVTAVDPDADSLAVAGVPVQVEKTTRLEDKTGSAGQGFGLRDVQPGDLVEVRGAVETGGVVRARLLERQDPAGVPACRLRGPVEEAAEPFITLLGQQAVTGGGTVFRRQGNQPLSSVEFFERATAGDVVEITLSACSGIPLEATTATLLQDRP
jgi:hypothetical protein